MWGITNSGALGPSGRKVTRKVQCVKMFWKRIEGSRILHASENGRIFKDFTRAWKHNQAFKIYHKPELLAAGQEDRRGRTVKMGRTLFEKQMTENAVCL